MFQNHYTGKTLPDPLPFYLKSEGQVMQKLPLSDTGNTSQVQNGNFTPSAREGAPEGGHDHSAESGGEVSDSSVCSYHREMGQCQERSAAEPDCDSEGSVRGHGRGAVAYVEGLGLVRGFMASDDMNACVEDLVTQRPKNIFASLISDDARPQEAAGGRGPGEKQRRLRLRRAVFVEMFKSKEWSKERDAEVAARLGISRSKVYKMRWDLQLVMKKHTRFQDFILHKKKQKCRYCTSMLQELDLSLKSGTEVMDLVEELS